MPGISVCSSSSLHVYLEKTSSESYLLNSPEYIILLLDLTNVVLQLLLQTGQIKPQL